MSGSILQGALQGALIGAIGGALVAVVFVIGRAIVRASGGRTAGGLKTAGGPRATGSPVGAVPAPVGWKAQAKRILLGLVWFLVIWLLARATCGAVAGAVAGSQTPPGYSAALAGQAAALQFLARYGLAVLLVSLAVAVWGTFSGVLPGTKLAARGGESVNTDAARGGVWPPPPTGPGAI